MTTLLKTYGGFAPPHPQVNKPSYRGPAAPGPPAKYPSHPQNPHTHFHRHVNGGLLQLGLAPVGFAQVGLAQIFGTRGKQLSRKRQHRVEKHTHGLRLV